MRQEQVQMQELALIDEQNTLSADLLELVERESEYRDAATATNTKEAYRFAWSCFESWCAEKRVPSLPTRPRVVSLYLTDKAPKMIDGEMKGLKLSSLRIRVAAIASKHKEKNLPFESRHPLIAAAMSGIARKHGAAVMRKEALSKDVLLVALHVYASGGTVKALRDRALLCIAFYGALRRSEVVALDFEDVVIEPAGLKVTLRRRKTDQTALGTVIAMPIKPGDPSCPVKAFVDYIAAAGVTGGALFRGVPRNGSRLLETRLDAKDFARVLKAAVEAAGYKPGDFSGHSARAGYITSCVRRGVPTTLIAKVSGHKSMDVLATYVRLADPFEGHPSKSL